MASIRHLQNRVRVEGPTGGWSDTAAPCVCCGTSTHAVDSTGLRFCQRCMAEELIITVDGCAAQLHARSDSWMR
jgi:hypothetical protein